MTIPELGAKVKASEDDKSDKYGGNGKDASESSNESVSGLAKDSPLQDIIDVMAEDHKSTKPKVILFYTNDGSNMKHCKNLFTSLANTVKYECAIALNHVFEVYRVDVGRSFHFKQINQDKAPLMLVLDTQDKIVAKAGGNGKKVSGTDAFKTLCKGASKMGIQLAKAVKEQDSIFKKLCKLDLKITGLKAQISGEASDKKKSKLKKDLAKLEKEMAKLKAKEKEMWAKIDKKIKEKSKA